MNCAELVRQHRKNLAFAKRETTLGFGLKKSPPPDVILTHYREDLHQDHRVISELTWNTFRNHLILEYEIPKYDGDLGRPNVFVPLSPELIERKIDHLLHFYASQRSKDWFTAETFAALARLRGIEAHAEHGLAEAFHARKIVL